jgi:hypothetical protein
MTSGKKTCFILMPISDHEDYQPGHFGRVYDHLIKPACEQAGFRPIRADDVVTTNYIALDIVKKIINSEMALCDLSSKNPNVLYELGIRQAFNLPVTLIKDSVTKRVFDIQGFRDFEYDETLRIDNVSKNISILAEILTNTYNNKSHEVNSLVSLLSIAPAKISATQEISTGTELILNSLASIESRIQKLEIRRPNQSSASHVFVPGTQISEGMRILHPKFGEGTVLQIDASGADKKGIIEFDESERKRCFFHLLTWQF